MSSGKPCLLVVDDEPLNRDLLQRVLESDYQVFLAEDAEEAEAILASDAGKGIQVVLSDHWMPGKSGVEFAETVREQRPKLPFVLLTGFDQEAEVTSAKQSGVLDSVLAKPWRSTELRALIQELLR